VNNLTNKDYFIVDSLDKQTGALEYLLQHEGLISIDTETTGSNAFTCDIMGISISVSHNEAFYFVVRTFENNELKSIEETRLFKLREGLIKLLERPSTKIIMHNSTYDVIVLRRTMGIDCLPQLHADTILMKHTIDESKMHGLKDLAEKYLGSEWITAQEELKTSVINNGGKWTKEQKDMYKADLSVLGKYACADADMTGQLYDIFLAELQKQGLTKFYFDEEVHPLNKVVIDDMISNGVTCDLTYFNQLKDELTKEAIQLEAEAHKDLSTNYKKHYSSLEDSILEKEFPLISGGILFEKLYLNEGLDIIYNKKTSSPSFTRKVIEEVYKDNSNNNLLRWKLGLITEEQFQVAESDAIYKARRELFLEKTKKQYIVNLCSNDQLKQILFEKLGEIPTKTTDKNNAQVDEGVLDHFAKKYTFIASLLKLRKVNKLLSTYVEAVLEKNINGVVHPEWLQFGTDSGRFACQNPNFQNLPREDNRIKKGLIAKDGYTLIGSDYAQLEPRVFSHYSGEKNLINSFVRGDDFYGTIAVDVFEIKHDPNLMKKDYPDERQRAKEIGLGLAYGMKRWKLGSILGCDPDKAQKYIDKYWAKYSELNRFVNRSHGEAITYGQVKSEAGRVRRFTDIKKLKNSHKRADKLIYNKLLNLSINFKIQSLAASIVNRAIIAMYKEFRQQKLDAKIISQIHDEIIVEAKESQANQVAEIMKNIMENNYKLNVPLVAEPKISKRLSETK